MSRPVSLARHIVDPRILSDELDANTSHPYVFPSPSSPLPRAHLPRSPLDDATHPDMYSGLANYVFGSPRPPSRSPTLSYNAVPEAPDSISPLTPVVHRLSPDRTPRPSVFGQPASTPFPNVSSHPSQGAGRPAYSLYPSSSHPRRHSTTRDPSYSMAINSFPSRSRAVSGSDSERSEDPTSSTDPITAAFFSPQPREVTPDNASQHTFGRASRAHGVTAASSQDGATPSSSSLSVATSRSTSRASMRTTGQFSSDDELDFDYYDGSSSPVTFARDYFDEDVDPGPSTFRSSIHDGRRGSLPMAIPGAVQPSDPHATRSREGSILTIRRPSRSWDATSVHHSSHNGEDPTVILPKSEPLSRADWLSLEAQLQAKQQQAAEANVYDGLDLQYILSKRSEGSIRSFNSRLSFVQGVPGPLRSSPHLSAIALGPGSATTLPLEDSFMRHLQKHDRGFDLFRFFWSFQREKADASGSSSRRRKTAHHYRTDKSAKEMMSSRVQEMWRCGQVGRFKVDRLVIKRTFPLYVSFDSARLIICPSCDPNFVLMHCTAQSSDPAKGAQHRIHVRHIPDPFLLRNTSAGPHSVIHKHSRAVAFSIFRSHGLFAGRQAGGAGVGPSNTHTHMHTRLAIMLAPKKVQEQYTSTKTTRQLSTHGLLDNEPRSSRNREEYSGGRRSNQSLSFRERDSRDKEMRRGQETEDRGKAKTKVPSKGKGKSDKKLRVNPTESTESSTATSSAGSATNSAVQHVASALECPAVKIRLSPSVSSSTTVYGHDSASRPISPTSLLPTSISDSINIAESETSSIPPTRHHRDHRDSFDLGDRFPTRTTHAEAFSALDPNDIENLRAKAHGRANVDSGSTLTERFLRVFRGSSRADDHSTSSIQPRAFQPPWMVTAGRDQQEENDRVLNDLNASFRDVGLLHTNPPKSSKAALKRKANQGILDQVPDDCLYMLLPLWPGETDTATVHAETSSAASFVTTPENRQYLLVYYVPFGEAPPKDKKSEKKKAKQSHSSDSGLESDSRAVCLTAFRAVARVITYDELRLSGVRVPSDGLAINGPAWEAFNYPTSASLQDAQMTDTVVCQCHDRERGFDFLEHGLLKLGLCTREEISPQDLSGFEEDEWDARTVLTPIGRAAVEMIWLGCLAISTFGPQ